MTKRRVVRDKVLDLSCQLTRIHYHPDRKLHGIAATKNNYAAILKCRNSCAVEATLLLGAEFRR